MIEKERIRTRYDRLMLTLPALMQTPVGTAFMLFLAWGTAFTVAMLWSLGTDVLPLVDKGHLLVLLAFYVSAATVLVKLTITAAEVIWVTAANAVDDVIFYDVRKKIRARERPRGTAVAKLDVTTDRIAKKRWKRNIVWYVVGAVPPIVMGFHTFREPIAAAMTAVPSYSELLVVAIYCGLGLLAWSTSAFYRWRGYHSRGYRYSLAMGQILLLLGAFHAGGKWIWYLSEKAPRTVATLTASPEPVQMVIALPATDGLLAYINGAKNPTFLPWTQIVKIEGNWAARDFAGTGSSH